MDALIIDMLFKRAMAKSEFERAKMILGCSDEQFEEVKKAWSASAREAAAAARGSDKNSPVGDGLTVSEVAAVADVGKQGQEKLASKLGGKDLKSSTEIHASTRGYGGVTVVTRFNHPEFGAVRLDNWHDATGVAIDKSNGVKLTAGLSKPGIERGGLMFTGTGKAAWSGVRRNDDQPEVGYVSKAGSAVNVLRSVKAAVEKLPKDLVSSGNVDRINRALKKIDSTVLAEK